MPSAAYDTASTENTLQVSDTQLFGTKVVNETRFQWLRDASSQTAQSTDPNVVVPLSFTSGGSALGNQIDTTNHYEFQNYTSIQYTKHFLKFGARLRGVTDQNFSTAGFNSSYLFPSLARISADGGWRPARRRWRNSR